MPRFSEIWPEPMGHHAFMWRMKAPTEGGHQEIKNKIKDIIPLTPLPGDDDDDALLRIQQEHNEVFDAAVRAGFKDCLSTFDALVELIAENSYEDVLQGIHECVEHNASSLAYLRKVLDGKPKPEEDSGDWMDDLRRRGIGG